MRICYPLPERSIDLGTVIEVYPLQDNQCHHGNHGVVAVGCGHQHGGF